VRAINLGLVASIVFLFNLPFRYWRASVRKFSPQWLLSIHLSAPSSSKSFLYSKPELMEELCLRLFLHNHNRQRRSTVLEPPGFFEIGGTAIAL
jgi:hypothetical protein